MQLILIAILAIFPFSVSAKSVKINRNLRSHTLHYEVDPVTLKASGLKLSLKRSVCNKEIVDKFEARIREALRPPIKKIRPFENSIQIDHEGDIFYESIHTREGKYLLKLPEIFREINLQSKYKCGTQA